MIESAIQAIQAGREWSWSLIGILVIVFGLSIRSFFLHDILRGMKIKTRNWYGRTQANYQKRAALGWLFFALFVLGSMLLWRFDLAFRKYLSLREWIFTLSFLLIMSLICHLRAYAHAMIEVAQENAAADGNL